MAYNIDLLNAACTEIGATAGHIYDIDALNAICTALGITAGHKYVIDAYNAIAVYQGKAGASRYNIEALNLITEGAYKYEDDALVQMGSGLKLLPVPSIEDIQFNSLETVVASGDLINAGYTLLNYYRSERIFGNGLVKKVRFANKLTTDCIAINIYLYRFNGTNYDQIYTENVLSKITNTNAVFTVALNETVSVQEGDYWAIISIDGEQRQYTLAKTNGIKYKAGLPSNPLIISEYGDLSIICPIQSLGVQPMIIGIGDSLMEGHTYHQSMINLNGVASAPSKSWLGKINAVDSRFTYQDLGIGGQDLTGIEARFNSDVILKTPIFAAINGGMNDLLNSLMTKAQFIAKWTSILDMCAATEIIPIVWLLMPATVATNEQMAARDEWNDSLTTLFATYNKPKWILINWDSHLGKNRVVGADGNLWDLKTEYNADNIHLNEAGETKQADVTLIEIGKKFKL